MSCLLFTLTFLTSFEFSRSEQKLIFVEVLVRHGDRTPLAIYPASPYQYANTWPQGPGQLTKAGAQHSYLHGKFLRSRYVYGVPYRNFLSGNFNTSEILVESSSTDRTLMTAQGMMSGLYPPSLEEMWNPSIWWQPTPIYTKPISSDQVLYPDPYSCPTVDTIYRAALNSPPVVFEEKSNAEFYGFLTEETGIQSLSLDSIWEVQDSIYIEYLANIPLPTWTERMWGDQTTVEKLQALLVRDYILNYVYNATSIRLMGGPLLAATISEMKAKINGTLPQKLHLRSAHDTTILCYLSALGVYDGVEPEYLSTVFTELFQDKGSYYVRILYKNGSQVAQPIILTMSGCADPCPWNTFLELTAGNIPVNWAAECGL